MANEEDNSKKRGRPPAKKIDQKWFGEQIATLESLGQEREAEQLRSLQPETFRGDKPAAAYRERVRVEPDGTEVSGTEVFLEALAGGYPIEPDKRRARRMATAFAQVRSYLIARQHQTEEPRHTHGKRVYGPLHRRWDDAYIERLREKAEAACLALRVAWQRRGGHYERAAESAFDFDAAVEECDFASANDEEWPDWWDSLFARTIWIVSKSSGVSIETLRQSQLRRSRLR